MQGGENTRARESIARNSAGVASAPLPHPQEWRQRADRLSAQGKHREAAAAYLEHVRHSHRDPVLMDAAAALAANRLPEAERALKQHLKEAPTDVAAIRMLAELAVRVDRGEDAEHLLQRCLELAPGFSEARHHFAIVLHRNNKPREALAELDNLLAREPRQPAYRNLKAAVLCRAGEYLPAINIYADLLREQPQLTQVWLSYGHALKTAGGQEQAIDAYRRCLALDADFGEAYWSLANLKTFRFTDAEIATMRAALAQPELANEHRLHIEFALGKALEDRSEFADSFAHYSRANAQRLRLAPYRADDTTQRMRRAREIYSAEFFRERKDWGCPTSDPIFIVGMPRAGSTLLEQILSSHAQVEGTMELPEITSITRMLRQNVTEKRPGAYHDAVAALSRDEVRRLGELYMERSTIHRKLGRPFFIDKMPNNFAHIGLIHLILPNAKIIDARRDALACCVSNFTQHFARGQNFAYSLEDLGHYYCDYLDLMAHFDNALPGVVHRVRYENMVSDTESEVHALLDYCGLPFDAGCLRFFENERPVRTASSEQVRQPIYTSGIDHWRHFEPWLAPLKQILERDQSQHGEV